MSEAVEPVRPETLESSASCRYGKIMKMVHSKDTAKNWNITHDLEVYVAVHC